LKRKKAIADEEWKKAEERKLEKLRNKQEIASKLAALTEEERKRVEAEKTKRKMEKLRKKEEEKTIADEKWKKSRRKKGG